MKVLSINPVDNINVNHRKENKFQRSFELLTIKDGEIVELASARFYNTDSRSYCCLWVRLPNRYTSGSAFSSGYGYHRESTALALAINKAGIKLDTSIGGKGDEEMKEALQAIATYLGYEYSYVLKAHA